MSDIDFAHILLSRVLLGRYQKCCRQQLIHFQECLRALQTPIWQIIEVGLWIDLMDDVGITETQERARTALRLLRENEWTGFIQQDTFGCGPVVTDFKVCQWKAVALG